MKIYKASEWTDITGKVHVQCDDLVATGRNWIEPAKILGITPSDFIILLKNKFDAYITPYRKDGKISFISYHWDDLSKARKFKNFINAEAKKKSYMV